VVSDMVPNTPYTVIASNRPDLCSKRLASKAVGSLLKCLNPVIFCHERDAPAFRIALRRHGMELPVFTHCICSTDGSVPFGALRHASMELARKHMTCTNFGLLLDDDLLAIRFATSRRADGTWQFLKMSAELFMMEVQRLVSITAESGKPYFTGSFNADKKSGYDSEHPVRTGNGTWNGILGFFKNSPNPFDKEFSQGADGEAQCRIRTILVDDAVMKHWGLVFAFAIDSAAYAKGGARDRVKNLEEIVRRYPTKARIINQVKGNKAPILKHIYV